MESENKMAVLRTSFFCLFPTIMHFLNSELPISFFSLLGGEWRTSHFLILKMYAGQWRHRPLIPVLKGRGRQVSVRSHSMGWRTSSSQPGKAVKQRSSVSKTKNKQKINLCRPYLIHKYNSSIWEIEAGRFKASLRYILRLPQKVRFKRNG